MDLRKETSDNTLIIHVSGRLDTITAPSLEAEIAQIPENIQRLILDLASLEYMSSAGIRVILSADKIMGKRNGMVLRHVNDEIREILDMTGLIEFLNIEPDTQA